MFDNLSSIQEWLSDGLCQLATGGGFSTRQLYSDGEEALFAYKRPIILTSIEDVANRGDLLERPLILRLPPIEESERRTRAQLNSDFDAASPKILVRLLSLALGSDAGSAGPHSRTTAAAHGRLLEVRHRR